MRLITLEEHYTSPAYNDGPGKYFKDRMLQTGPMGVATFERLCEVGAKRIAAMDAAGVDVQLISLNSPGVEQADVADAIAVAREANDFAAEAVKNHPTRFAAMATVPTADPEKAAQELETRVSRQGFKGAHINGHTRGRYLDDKACTPLLACAEKLGVPIYIHPAVPPKAVIEGSFGGFPPFTTWLLSGPGWGWHLETAVHVLRMVVGGVFDRHPKLQVVIGHMGEGLPFMMPRMQKTFTREVSKLERSAYEYFRQNVSYTFGGFNYLTTFQNLLSEVGIDRILFSVDYPYGSMTEAREFLEGLPISAEDKAKIAHKNAERLFGF